MDLEGKIASRGEYTGKAIVLNDGVKPEQEDYSLVSRYCGPRVAAAMYKAKAVVTEEGGLMSHLAVVSREVGIPCITGVKDAASIFKDGDTLHVDAADKIGRKGRVHYAL
jgi:pyruvate,water dikinase